MKLAIHYGKHRINLPLPLFMLKVAIRLIPDNKIQKQQKYYLLKISKTFAKNLKGYKGMSLVEIEAAQGARITITV